MRHRWQSMLGGGLACCLLLLGTSLAYGEAPVRRASTLIGSAVELQAGGKFGQIEDLIINDDGCVDFLVVVFEDKLFAVPFGVSRLDFARRVVFLDVERELLLRAPSFARNRFPDLSASSDFGRKVHSHFQTQGREGASKSRQTETRPADRQAPEKGKQPEKSKQPEKRKPSEEKKRPEDKKSPQQQ